MTEVTAGRASEAQTPRVYIQWRQRFSFDFVTRDYLGATWLRVR